MTNATLDSARVADFINPVLGATRDVFEMMLGCTPKRVGLKLKEPCAAGGSVSGVIGITGGVVGTIGVRLPKQMAMDVLERMVGTKADAITPDVCDAVGELTNLIAGAAKSKLAHLNLSVSLPNVVSGEAFDVAYPSDVSPFCILFDSELGSFVIEAGFSQVS
jgi:chemotaxis protein CheX